MIILREISLGFGNQKLFDRINCTFELDKKIGVFGRNGSGKSTLLQVIAQQASLDEGSVDIKKNSKIGYMPQSVTLSSIKNVYDEAFTIFDHYTALEKKLASLELHLPEMDAADTSLLDEYIAIQEELSFFNRPQAEKNTHMILDGLGFEHRKTQSVNALSVGWKMRLVLAKLLLTNADFYLFDEPTNHLDLQTKEWFFSYLSASSFGYLLVTHDRHFLEHASNQIFYLENGKGKLFPGNFSTFLQKKEDEDSLRLQQYKQQQKEIAQKEKTINRFRASASKAKMAQSMIKKLESIERIEIEPLVPKVNFSFHLPVRPGRIILSIENLSFSYGQTPLFQQAKSTILRGKKVALVAPNGTGKTTLFNLITGKLSPQEGTITFGHNVEMAYFEQDQTLILDPKKTILEEVCHHNPGISETEIRTLLGSFLFPGDFVNKKINVLSGGEKNRVAMVKTLLKKANFLVLDEPTNHLDLHSKDILLQALQQYDGTMVVVSHDHDFIHNLADTILVLTQNGLEEFPGTYEEYLEKQKQAQSNAEHSLKNAHNPQTKTNHETLSYKQAKKFERRIEELEKKRDSLYAKQFSFSYGSEEYISIEKQVDAIKQQLEELYSSWESSIE